MHQALKRVAALAAGFGATGLAMTAALAQDAAKPAVSALDEAPAADATPATEAPADEPAAPSGTWDPPSRWPAFHVGISGGAHLVVTDWGAAIVSEQTGLYVSPDSGLIARLRLGAQFSDILGIEISGGWVPLSAAGKDVNAFEYDAGLQLFFSTGTWRPFFMIGGGVYHFPDGEQRQPNADGTPGLVDNSDFDPMFFYGVGLRAMATDWFAGRIDLRHMFSDGLKPDGPAIGSNIEASIGVDFIFGGAPPPPPPDKDGDGTPDHQDACPDVTGPIDNKGCPPIVDQDGDGVLDTVDECPTVAGPAATGGCPDQDGDGIADSKDKCPTVGGPAATEGCPDKDGDGIVDSADECPDVKGLAEFLGCPDDDKDGIPNNKDRCPRLAGPADNKGCPPPSEEVKKQFSGSIEGIGFETGSAKLTNESQPVIDKAAAVLKEYGNLHIRVEGHTDTKGKKAANQKLSEERANSVREALITAGIGAERIEAVGYGQEKPKATNRNEKGRAQNRRIEFKIINQ